MFSNITIGSDPEFFISSGSHFVPSTNLIPGDKDNPYPIGDGFFIQRDNVLIEGNIPPAKNKEEYIYNMKHLKDLMNDYLQIINPNLHIVCADSAEFDLEMLKRNPEANVFGCHPYENAWTGETTKAKSLSHLPYRTCGFHHHIGYQIDSRYDKKEINKLLVKAYDFFVTTQARKIYNDKIRSYYYGELGSYRHCVYGVEVRSLGGYFAQDEYLPKIYDGIMQSIEYVNELLITNREEILANITSIKQFKYDNALVFSF